MTKPERIWGELSSVKVAKPSEKRELTLPLPAGIRRGAPPKGKAPAGCAPVEGLSRLAAPGRELHSCCRQTPTPPPEAFTMGCLLPFACSFVDGAGKRAATLGELAELVGPIDTPGKALGLVSLAYPEVFDPFWLEDTKGVPYDYQALPHAPAPFEIVRTEEGFTVRLPMAATCGCSHHAVRVAFHVSRAGCIARLKEPPVPLAWSEGLCVD